MERHKLSPSLKRGYYPDALGENGRKLRGVAVSFSGIKPIGIVF